jgi:hypothetical protein
MAAVAARERHRLAEAGRAKVHPVARLGLIPDTAMMFYARTDAELEVVERVVRPSSAFARGHES